MIGNAEAIWRWAVLALFVAYVAIRWYYFARYRKGEITGRGAGFALDYALTRLAGVAMLLPTLLYLTKPAAVGFATLSLPEAVRWLGAIIALTGAWLLAWSHAHLRHAFSPEVNLAVGQTLVTTGPYRRVRHPMYTSFYVFWLGMGLLGANWLLAVPGLVSMTALLIYRLPREERLMLEAFGEEYREYQARTGLLLPHSRKMKSSDACRVRL